MFILTAVLAAVLAIAFIGAGISKLLDVAAMADARQHLRIEPGLFKVVGALETLGGVGVLLGLLADLPLIGVLAALGLIGMTVGAVFYHQRAGDSMKEWLPAVAMGSVAIFYIIARIASA